MKIRGGSGSTERSWARLGEQWPAPQTASGWIGRRMHAYLLSRYMLCTANVTDGLMYETTTTDDGSGRLQLLKLLAIVGNECRLLGSLCM